MKNETRYRGEEAGESGREWMLPCQSREITIQFWWYVWDVWKAL